MTVVSVAGEYGVGFTGDDAMLYGIVRGLVWRFGDPTVNILSRVAFQPLNEEEPSDTAERWSLQMLDVRENLARYVPQDVTIATTQNHWKVISESDLLIVGGGNILTDINWYPPHAPLTYYSTAVRVAKACGVPVMACGVGVGPLRTRWGERLTVRLLADCDLVVVRDARSLAWMERRGLEGVCYPDLALGLPVDLTLDRKDVLMVAPRWHDGGEEWLPVMKEAVARISAETGLEPYGVPHSRYADAPADDDVNICRLALPDGTRICTDERVADPVVLLHLYAQAAAALTVRLHGAVFAAKARIPFVAMAYMGKVEGFCDHVGMPALPLSASADQIVDTFLEQWKQRVQVREFLDMTVSDIEDSLDQMWIKTERLTGGAI